jgi:hypothetical protein
VKVGTDNPHTVVLDGPPSRVVILHCKVCGTHADERHRRPIRPRELVQLATAFDARHQQPVEAPA